MRRHRTRYPLLDRLAAWPIDERRAAWRARWLRLRIGRMSQAITAAGPGDGLFVLKLDNRHPVALDDLSLSFGALGQAFQDYLLSEGLAPPAEGVRLYVHELRTGSIIASFQAIADQARLVFGEHGVIDTLRSAYDAAEKLAPFATHLNDIIQFFLSGKTEEKPPTKKEAEQVINFMEPLARDQGSAMTMQFNGGTNSVNLHFHYNSEQANAVQNSAKRYLGPALPSNRTLHDEVMTLHQVRGDTKSKAGDTGIIESITRSPVKLLFTSPDIKRAILDAPENPFQLAFIVDVEVKTVNDKPALYKVLAVKDTFDKPN